MRIGRSCRQHAQTVIHRSSRRERGGAEQSLRVVDRVGRTRREVGIRLGVLMILVALLGVVIPRIHGGPRTGGKRAQG